MSLSSFPQTEYDYSSVSEVFSAMSTMSLESWSTSFMPEMTGRSITAMSMSELSSNSRQ